MKRESLARQVEWSADQFYSLHTNATDDFAKILRIIATEIRNLDD